MKPIDVKSKLYINYNKGNNYKNAKLVIMWEYQNKKSFFQKVTFQIGPKKN